MNDRSAPSGQNRLLAALQPADFSLLKPYLKQTVLEQGLEEAACECYSVIRKRTDQALPKADV
jgi:hypothetical protein